MFSFGFPNQNKMGGGVKGEKEEEGKKKKKEKKTEKKKLERGWTSVGKERIQGSHSLEGPLFSSTILFTRF